MSARVQFPTIDDVAGPRRRLKLWELEHGFHCSVVGTCLSPGTARQIVRRARLEVEPGMQDYRLHSVLVSEAARPGVVARLIAKALDDAFAGTVRRVGAAVGGEELAALWDRLCERGEVAAAYWAFMTHGHLPAELRVRIFGEVHMLSHFMGGHNRAHAKALWLAERRVEQLAERLARSRRQAAGTLAERDGRIAELGAELARTRDELARRVARVLGGPRSRAPNPERLHRRVLAARARLRQAEDEIERLRRLVDVLADGGHHHPTRPAAPDPAAATPAPTGAPVRCLLYVGGRCSLVPHLRRHAETRRVELLHHDGGEEQNLQALEGLVGRADAVFCPVDCVSHQACLAAKQLCRRLAKPFVPLRTGSGTCFLRAVDRWRAVVAAPTEVARARGAG